MKTNAIKCHECKKYFFPGTGLDGLPNGVGFVCRDEKTGKEKTINVCKTCLIRMGQEAREDAEED